MRLLNTQTLKLEEFYEDVPKYAILSHRWGKEEVTFQDVSNDRAMTNRGWPKVVVCCRMAASRNMSYVWIDTCCIDKSSSAELTESINTMYAWYQQATECYAFLSDVHGSLRASDPIDLAKEISDSVWFTRGWTLQELIAPTKLIFFNSRWERLWAKSTHSRELQDITHISRRLLEGDATLSDYSLAQRMAWAANRKTTRIEDEAYCLLGIFQVNMPMLYGEGKNAFRRLQEEIIKQSDDQTLFAWHDDRDIKPVLAPSVSCFRDLHDLKCIYATNDSRFGHTLSNSGLNIKLMLIPWDMDIYVAPLSCGRALVKPQSPDSPPSRGYSRMAIFLRRTKFEDHLVRVNVDGMDFVMLDSDIVAYKRDSFGIKDRQVFVRQSLVDMSDQVHYSFAFNYYHPWMFRNGRLPTPNLDMLNFYDRDFGSYMGAPLYAQPTPPLILDQYLAEPYSHYESVAFDIRSLSTEKRPHYLHLGFDMDFTPVCLITTEPFQEEDRGRRCEHDFEGMHSLRSEPVSSLAWLLSQVRSGTTSTSILAFKATSGASTEVRCNQLSLKIRFEVSITNYKVTALKRPAKMWHVTFEYFENIPPTPSTSHVPLPSPASMRPADWQPVPRQRKRSSWLKFMTFKNSKVKPQKSTFSVEEWIDDSSPQHRFRSDITQVRERSNITEVREISQASAMTQVLNSQSPPGYAMESVSYTTTTMAPAGNVITPVPASMTPNLQLPPPRQEHTVIASEIRLITTASSSTSQKPLNTATPETAYNLIAAGLYQMGSDELRQAIAAYTPAAEYIQPRQPGTVYEMDGNDSHSNLYPDLPMVLESEPDFTQSDTTPTSSRYGNRNDPEWSAQTVDYLRKVQEHPPPAAGLRVMDYYQ